MRMIRAYRNLLIVIAVFTVLYTLISIVNHYNFRTYALDLGLYTNALWDYAHFQWNDSGVFKTINENLLADHFDLYLLLFSPFIYLFGSYTLLILQIFFVLLGGLGVYRYFCLSERTREYAIAATVFYYMFFGVFSALSFDYHSNTVAASLVPWFFYFVRREKLLPAVLMLLAIVISKENVSLWMSFVCIGLMIEYRKNKPWRRIMLIAALSCLAYFLIVVSLVMPALSNALSYPHFNYSILGNNMKEALIFLLTHPLESIKYFFVNHISDPEGNFVKIEFLVLLLVSGLYILFRKPAYLLMMLPLFFQKFYHDNITMWGISSQYSVEFAPILAIGIFSSIAISWSARVKKAMIMMALAGCFVATYRIMDMTIMHTDKARIRFYQAKHYTRDYNVRKAHRALDMIPADAIVSAQSPFVPHLALRDNIYQWPMVKNADYVVLSIFENPYPVNRKTLLREIENLSASPGWEILYDEDGLFVFRKRNQ